MTPEPITAETAALLARVPNLACAPETTTSDTLAAAVSCEPTDASVGTLTLKTVEKPEVLRTAWRAAAPADERRVGGNACTTAYPDTDKWGFGNIACGVQDGVARIDWTDARIGLLGSVEGTSDDVSELYAWWRTNARKIGRSAESAQDTPKKQAPSKEPAKPEPSPLGKFVRVPGSPNAISCAANGPTIPDTFDRAWRLTTLEFQNRKNYERVILNLERVGKNNTKWPTEARVERMPLSQVTKAVPKAPRSKRGKVGIVVKLDGVRDAPNLYSYRPKSLDYLKEVSLVRDGNGRALVLSSPQGTCYQVRIPVWAANATGKERKAEVFVDLRPK